MDVTRVSENVYSIGVLNPNVRISDVIVPTECGTTYNSYLIKGEKNILIDVTHPRFFDEYIENVRSVVDPSKIDYVIMNHNEPDHSGSLEKLLEVAPQAQVLSSTAGCIYLRNILNKKDGYRAVKEGETLDIGGGKELRFMMAPFLHWPDTMFTYFAAEKMIFTCDFLGAHYCEPRMIDKYIDNLGQYEKCFKTYFSAIFGPFKPYVLKGLEKLNSVEADIVCPSHGPILTKGNQLERSKELIKEWSQPETHNKKYIPIFFCSAYGYTTHLAEKISEGIKSVIADADVEIMNVNEHPLDELAGKINNNDAFLLGSPTINKNAVPPIWNLLSTVDVINIKGRHASAFGSFGWSGEAVPMLLDQLKMMKLNVFESGYTVRFVPTKEDDQAAFDFGKRFAQQL
ncbi:MAG TPA: MBL fold metallo-hydrolase [Ruminococcaceae bacterium]|nr:MBL fold metallo-hydrolase [Oscillospiraceae bacterium]